LEPDSQLSLSEALEHGLMRWTASIRGIVLPECGCRGHTGRTGTHVQGKHSRQKQTSQRSGDHASLAAESAFRGLLLGCKPSGRNKPGVAEGGETLEDRVDLFARGLHKAGGHLFDRSFAHVGQCAADKGYLDR
jgi:hypothetical protein